MRNIKKKRRQKTWITHDANDGQRNYTPVDAVDVELSNFIKVSVTGEKGVVHVGLSLM